MCVCGATLCDEFENLNKKEIRLTIDDDRRVVHIVSGNVIVSGRFWKVQEKDEARRRRRRRS